ncbi:hypothetical protein [Ferruginibacter profundus]
MYSILLCCVRFLDDASMPSFINLKKANSLLEELVQEKIPATNKKAIPQNSFWQIMAGKI